ncbi:hypothetical protein [uncultured Ruminococcus sp.]|uniref:hypothetical protein n=1 Tax=uncultured Ruminococcus sp. TaxID=165186 RepID=UPI0025EA95E6|nr:hypothetical protein [uncultured Ruminococcus sp.]
MYTENKKKNNLKYDKAHMKTIAIKTKIEEIDQIKQNAQNNNMNTSLFCRKCIRYCIENKVDLSNVEL